MPAQPLKIVIIGAGIGGCTAAVALRQQGHHVTLLERSQLANEAGAAIHLPPNAYGLVKRLGIEISHIGANKLEWTTIYKANGELIKDVPTGKINEDKWKHDWLLSHRADLHIALKRKCTEESDSSTSIAAQLLTSSEVTDVDCESGTVTMKDGRTFKGDVLIGADGVKSIARRFVAGDDIKPRYSGKSAFRWVVPRAAVIGDNATKAFTQRSGQRILASDGVLLLVMYPCRNNTLLNFVAIFPDSEDNVGEGWSQEASKERLLQVFAGFEANLQSLIDKADPNDLKIYNLQDMEVLTHWTKHRVALLGDAAHPFLPYGGQGGACAIEDAVSLAVMLPLGTTPAQVPERLQLYEECRMERAHTIQQNSRDVGQLKDFGGPVVRQTFTAYNFGHDEFYHSTQRLREWEDSQNASRTDLMPLGEQSLSERLLLPPAL